MKIEISGAPKEIAALVAALQERRDGVSLVRKPYRTEYEATLPMQGSSSRPV